MIQAVLRLVAPDDKREEILQVLRSLSGPIEATKGCRFCRVLCDAFHDNLITYWVQLETREALQAHLGSERFQMLLPYIDMSLEPPEVEFSNLNTIGGMDFIVSAIRAQRP